MRRADVYALRARGWASAWREVATFVDRIRGAAVSDADGAAGQGFYTRLLVLAEELLRDRDPTVKRLWPPPELAAEFPGGPPVTLADGAVDLRPYLPGAWDAEAAVRQVDVSGVDDPDDFEDLHQVAVRRHGRQLTFREPDGAGARLVDVEVAVPTGLPTRPGGDLRLDVDHGYFTREQRASASEAGRWAFVGTGEDDGVEAADDEAPRPVRAVIGVREPQLPTPPAGPVTEAALAELVGGLLTGTLGSGEVAAARANALTRAATMDLLRVRVGDLRGRLTAAHDQAWAADAGTLAAELEGADDALAAVAAAWRSIAAALGGSGSTVSRARAAQAALPALAQAQAALQPSRWRTLALDHLDAIVADRIAYGDGSLRQLRLLEVGFAHHWGYRRRWFIRRSPPLTVALRDVLGRYEAALATARAGGALGSIGVTTAARPEALAVGTRRIGLVGDGQALGITSVDAGGALWVEGERPSLAFVTGGELAPDGGARLRVMPLRVSLVASTRKRPLPGTPGLVGLAPTLTRTGNSLADADLRRGRSATHPEVDGRIEAAVNLWSTVCLLQGTAVTDPRVGGVFPAASALNRWLRADIRVFPEVLRLLVEESELGAGQWWDSADPTRSVLARPGELLLVRARGEHGLWWQSVGEVRRVLVLSREKADATPGTASPDAPLCCGGPGELVAVEMEGLAFPEPVDPATIRVGREFLGFGVASLAARELLPREIDPANATAPREGGLEVDRRPELAYALPLLDRLLGVAP